MARTFPTDSDVPDARTQFSRSTSLLKLMRGAWSASSRFRPVLVLVVCLVVALSLTQPVFLTGVNVRNLLTGIAILWIVSLAMTMVLLTAAVDLSVGAIAVFSGIVLAHLLNTGMNAVLALPITIVVGAAIGAGLNGYFIAKLSLNFFIVTLASLSILTGVASLWSKTDSIPVIDATVSAIGIGTFLGIPWAIWLMAVLFVAVKYMLTYTYLGRDIYAVGGSITAAGLSGIRATRTLVIVYGISGAFAALAGIVQTGQVGVAIPNVDPNLALSAVAAVLLGGTSLIGGAGGIGGTVVGVIFIGVLQNGLSIAGVPSFWQQVVTGGILLLAVLSNRLRLRRVTQQSQIAAPQPGPAPLPE